MLFLFLFYIDDLTPAVGAPQISLFADDVAAWARDTYLERAIAKLQKGLDAITSWCMSWKIELSALKSECSFFTTNTQEAKWRPALYHNEKQIKYCPRPIFIGITYDQQLTFGLHMSIVGSKMKQQGGALMCLGLLYWGYNKSILRSTYIATDRSMSSMQQRHGYHGFHFQQWRGWKGVRGMLEEQSPDKSR